MKRFVIAPDRENSGGFNMAGEYTHDVASGHYPQRLLVAGSNNAAGFGVFEVRPGQKARQIMNGPLIEGPFAATFGMSSVISANPAMSTGAEMDRERKAGLLIEAQAGDVLVMEGRDYLIVLDGRGYVGLVLITPDMDLDVEVAYAATTSRLANYYGRHENSARL